MGLPRQMMIEAIKKEKDKYGYPYTHLWTKAGRTPIELAPDGNLFFAWRRITGTKKEGVKHVVL